MAQKCIDTSSTTIIIIFLLKFAGKPFARTAIIEIQLKRFFLTMLQ